MEYKAGFGRTLYTIQIKFYIPIRQLNAGINKGVRNIRQLQPYYM